MTLRLFPVDNARTSQNYILLFDSKKEFTHTVAVHLAV